MPVKITPLENKPLGAKVTLPEGCTDPSTLNEEDFQTLYNALLTHLVLVIPGMENLTPKSQWKLTTMFDSSCDQTGKSYGHGKEFRHAQSVLRKDGTAIPDQPQVQVLGQGTFPPGHYGLDEITLTHPTHFTFHKDPLPEEKCFNKNTGAKDASNDDLELTRYYRWHIDSALYKLSPPVCTTLLGIHVPPHNRLQKIVYEDNGDELNLTQGATCFVSGANAFDLLSDEDKELALHSTVVYAPHPYIFISPAGATADGLTMVSEGKEMALDKLPEWEEKYVKKLPLVWTNPVTKKQHLQVHGCCIYQLILPDGSVLELEEARKKAHKLMRPAIDPQHVYAHSWDKGDLCIFFNRGVWHSVTGQFDEGEKRLMHQCNIASGNDPVTILSPEE
ncbi:TauD/TfdA dioxygenase family protein [Saccharomycodes ludwigii]|uniref:TauD/TfdA dioxygenase family protein n=1 Tax=Saccharomycodes ludwigii TaxID=36035 RepID=UPI001E82752B|nr:conserved putative dioxygenase [Saccharomycodes ludwigii]KAH3902787.1 conserved putative dioxygenase [Saccharomycodes ludwigii]